MASFLKKNALTLLSFGVPLGIFTWTRSSVWALDTLYSIDSAEMVISAHTLGIDHPPGHPLYLILAHLFSILPFDPVDGGVIFSSVFFASLAACFLAHAIFQYTNNIYASITTAWIFSFNFIFWIHATIAEVYALQLCFLGLFLFLSARWLKTRSEQTILALAFFLGLGATTNILLVGLLVPAVLLLLTRGGVCYEKGKWQPGRLTRATLLGFLGLTPFFYIPLRLNQNAQFITDFVYLNGFEVQSFRWYWWYLSAEEFTTTMLFDTPLSNYPALLTGYFQSYAANASSLSALLGIVGLVSLSRYFFKFRKRLVAQQENLPRENRRRSAVRARHQGKDYLVRLFSNPDHAVDLLPEILCLAFVCTLLPVLSYQVPDKDVFFMPSFFFLTAFAGLGIHELLKKADRLGPQHGRIVLGLLITISLPAYLVLKHYPRITQITWNESRYSDRLDRFGKLPENAIIVAEDDGHATRYRYFQHVLNLRPDVTIHTLGRLAPRFRGEIDLSGMDDRDLSVSLNLSDRLRILQDPPGIKSFSTAVCRAG